MNPLQNAKYFREWGKVRAHYIAQGIDPKQADAKRHELHKKALGQMKSSKAFTNADLDKVLATFYAITRPADLEAQLHQIEQPEKRISALLIQVRDLAGKCVDKPGREGAYLDGMARRVFDVEQYHKLTEPQLAQLAGILRARIAQLQRQNEANFPAKKQPVAAHAQAAQEAEENPDWMY